MTIASWVRRHPLTAYFALAYGISWGGILILLAGKSFHLAVHQPQDRGLFFVLMLLGPSTSGLALTAVLDGRAGLHELWMRLTRWRVGPQWYAVALLTTPLLVLAILWPLSAFVSPAFAPRFQAAFFALGLVVGSFEEIGWTGFATPRLLHDHSPPMAGALLGLGWALWHLVADATGNISTMGIAWFAWFAVFWMAALPAYRILMTWVYANSKSVLLAVLMHAGYTGWLFVLYPATSFGQGLVWQAGFAASLWVAAAIVGRWGGPAGERVSGGTTRLPPSDGDVAAPVGRGPA